ncbi:MAG TPA: hypothetical protein VHN37_08985, partial [Actinomycetota bacterium]|nr:hypothetical protein [Actinomycetota bacterium]
MKRLISAVAVAAALVLPASPAAADESARAGVEDCREYGGGYHGVWAWYYDLDNRYHRVWTCIYTGP